MKAIIFLILLTGSLFAQVQDSTVYQLTEPKIIDGVEPCNYAQIEYILDDTTVVGCYGKMDSVFIPLYCNATIPKNVLINYQEEK